MDGMNILISTNDSYVMPLTVLLESIFENNAGPLTFYFMWSELSEQHHAFFADYVSAHGAELVYVPVGKTEFRDLPTKKYISRETYFRLLAADCLPRNVDRILWLDADMVVNGDIWDLYRTDFQGCSVVACPHGAVMRPTMYENCRELGIRHPEQYFNAGVMLCDLARWRQMDIPKRIADILAEPRKMMFPGQDLTNLIFNGTVRTADWRVYNCMTHSVLPEELPALASTARIIHFAGTAKPRNLTDIPFEEIWKGYYDRSPFASVPLKRTSYTRMKRFYEKYLAQHPETAEGER